jgi:hypothetical protein
LVDNQKDNIKGGVMAQKSSFAGWVYFAGILMLIGGIFQSIAGLTALLNDKFYALVNESLLVVDVTTWGWIHLLLGLFIFAAGMAVLSGHLWGRIVAIILAILSIAAQFVFIGAYPLWSILTIIVDIVIIYALVVQGDE